MTSRLMLVLVLTLQIALPVSADDRFTGVRFLGGVEGVRKNILGHLVLAQDGLVFRERTILTRTTKRFEIPFRTITAVTRELQGPNAGTVAALGVMGLGSRDEVVYVTTETETAVNVVGFTVPRHASPGLVAKIEFAVKRARERR